jgi:hypothetical protein
MTLRVEPTPDDPRVVAFVYGPMVLAADLGPASAEWEGPAPALVAGKAAGAVTLIDRAALQFRMPGAVPQALGLKPFFNQYDRRTAVYFPLFTDAQWANEKAAFLAAQQEKAALEARTVDVIHLGEMQPERDHDFIANQSDLISYGGRSGRQVWWGDGNYFELGLAVGPGPMTLRATYWGEEIEKNFDIFVDGVRIANERRKAAPTKAFIATDYPIPLRLTRGKKRVTVRFETRGSDAPVYEVRMLSQLARPHQV